MLVKHMIRELMKCDPELEMESDNEKTYYLHKYSNRINLLTTGKYAYDNTDDTPFPLPEKE